MEIQQKPDYLIFAEGSKSGELSDFPDISRGWGITVDQTQSKPPLEWMNGAFNRVDANTLYLIQQGVPEWDASIVYPVDAITKYKSVLYIATLENDNAIPSTNTTKWKKLIADIANASTSQKGVVQLSSATDSDSEATAATSKAVNTVYDLADGALPKKGGTVTGDTSFTGKLQQNGSNVITEKTISGYQNKLGIGQVWTDVTTSRAIGTTYTNTSSAPIQVSIACDFENGEFTILRLYSGDNIIIGSGGRNTASNSPISITAIIPIGGRYTLLRGVGNANFRTWAELR